MSDTSILLFINGLTGKIPAVDGFFKGFSNDYFPVITACLVLIWMWFATRDSQQREINRRAVITAVFSIGLVSAVVKLSDLVYFRPRPFDVLPSSSLNLLFYRPTDSSFPSNLAAVAFAIAVTVFIKNKAYGSFLLALAVVSSFGRVYMGVHYPLDIVGGAAAGVIASAIAYGFAGLLRPGIDFVLNLQPRNPFTRGGKLT
jgi:undecaprenyl-diphosphatase